MLYNTLGGERNMIYMYEKAELIHLHKRGMSYRNIAQYTGINRKTVAKYCNVHKQLQAQLQATSNPKEIKRIQEQIIEKPTYKRKVSTRRKYTNAMDAFIDELLEQEKEKTRQFGPHHKQKMTITLMHELLRKEGFDIGVTTVRNVVHQKRKHFKETFIRQTYTFGQRLEFDYGEVWLIIGGIKRKYYLAVLSSPASGMRMAYLYTHAGKRTFLDAHTRFFTYAGGVYKEVVYDNL